MPQVVPYIGYMAVAAAATATAASSAYSAKASATASKKATAAQERIAMEQLKAAKEGEIRASETAKNKMKLRQASQTRTILTDPMGVNANEDQINAGGLSGTTGV